MLSLCNTLSDQLQHALEFLRRANDPTLDQLKFRPNGASQFFRGSLVRVYGLDCCSGFRVFAYQIIFSRDWIKQRREMLRESSPGSEEV